jgi:bifunctional UDP-N-acetylglucosamine pyrophosphorylase/glucosamine-1-phosphate N-acetyltransferase
MTDSKFDLQLAVLILAAGKGSRMKSKLPKVLHTIAGKPMIKHIIDAAETLLPSLRVAVLSPNMDVVAREIKPYEIAIQSNPQGTGDAVAQSVPHFKNFDGDVIILYGDVPLVSSDTLKQFLDHHRNGKFGATILAMAPPEATGYGRIFQNADGTLKKIVEESDATQDEKLVRLCNSGLMIVRAEYLTKYITKLSSKNAQNEKFLTDLPSLMMKDNIATGIIRGDFYELRGVNTRAQLAELEMAWQHKKRIAMMDAGVTLQDSNTIYFHHDTEIDADTIIGAHVVFGANVKIDSDVDIKNFCHLEGVHVKSGATIGPFARIRPHTVIGHDVKIGNFVEIKAAILHDGAKASHLSYIGDAELGENVNFGCGAITVNYDGISKHKTIIGKNVMVGSNSSLVAPITLGDNSYIAAGSTVTESVQSGDLVIARARQVNKSGRGKNRLKPSKS